MIPTNIITIYGRKPIAEVIDNQAINIWRLHLSKTNKQSIILNQIINAAKKRNIEIAEHSRKQLSFISKNMRQDQGIACDIELPKMKSFNDYLLKLKNPNKGFLFALDGVTNPQNLGMTIRSLTASSCDGILINAKTLKNLSPLAIKASAGSIFKSKILVCENVSDALVDAKKKDLDVIALCSNSKNSIKNFVLTKTSLFVLGNETTGISEEVRNIANATLNIPLMNGVESLNVAVSAAVTAFMIQDSGAN